jgi:hypothetical protein
MHAELGNDAERRREIDADLPFVWRLAPRCNGSSIAPGKS